jgi:hypothetical protein
MTPDIKATPTKVIELVGENSLDILGIGSADIPRT